MDVRARFDVREYGDPADPVMVLAHGFGCDQSMWRLLVPMFADRHRVITYDQMGLGGSDRSAYDPERYSTLAGYADDLLLICDGLDLRDLVLVGHSVGAMIGVLAAAERPERFAALVLIGPSPRYVDDGSYVGGFSAGDIEELLDDLDANYLGWAGAMAPAIMGRPDRPELGEELRTLFCRTDPAVARRFARATFLADNRADLERVRLPSLVLQCRNDVIAPQSVGQYVHHHLAGSTLVALEASGHCPNLSAPDETAAAIDAFLAGLVPAPSS